jgi:hypothetical protein
VVRMISNKSAALADASDMTSPPACLASAYISVETEFRWTGSG